MANSAIQSGSVLSDEQTRRKNKAVAVWLLVGLAMIIVQTLLGGVTRLSGSGLSITEWDVVTGALPPLSHEAWLEEFAKYQQSSQFKYLNSDFALSDFKSIFFWEWFHRLWARSLGVVFAIPFVYFLVKKYFTESMVVPFVVLFVLGALQGAIGWIMVSSGLVGNAIYVRPTRLAIHFVLAMALACYVLWFALKLLVPEKERVGGQGLQTYFVVILALLMLQLVYGALMAGHKAASAAATWPTINGSWLPQGMAQSQSGHPLVENKMTIHFIHRNLAYLLAILITVASIKIGAKQYGAASVWKKWRFVPQILVLVQIALGIVTVLNGTHIIPNRWGFFESVAELHQLVAMFLMLSLVVVIYLTGTAKAGTR
ncbi:MAG: COX15/CtaA family protein [Edaphocola sp.]